MVHMRISSVIVLLATTLAMSAQEQRYSLNDCIDYAISHNIDIQQRAVQISQKEIALNTSKHAWLPNLNLEANQLFGFDNPAGASGGGGGTSTPTMSQSGTATTAVLRTTMPLFDGFKIQNQIKADQFSLSSASANLEAAKKDISIQVATFYLQCLYYRGMADVARNQVETSREMVKRATIRVEEGKRPRSEQAEAEAQLAADEHALVNNEGQYTLALITLAHLLNMPDVEGFRIIEDEQALGLETDTLLRMPQEIFESTVSQWPAIMAAQADITQSEFLLKVKKADYYPRLNLTGSIGTIYYNAFHQSNPGGFGHQLRTNRGEMIGLTLSYPIFSRFETRNSVRQASYDIINKKLALENAKLKLRKDIQTAYYNADIARQKRISSAKACESSRISVEYEEVRYEEGRSNIFDLLQARQKYLKAQQDAVQAKYEQLIRQRILHFYYALNR